MKGRLTLPTDLDIIEKTLELKERLGADALRDCDGTNFPRELKDVDAKIYATYYTTRKDNEWAKANPSEIQQEYLMTDHVCAFDDSLSIELLKNFNKEQFAVNYIDDPYEYWEVIDRTSDKIIKDWSYDKEKGTVTIKSEKYHVYTVSFLAFLIWDPVHMYNYITNDWQNSEHQLTYDVRQPKTREYVKKKLDKYLSDNPHIDVVRFTTFFHQFTLTFDNKNREKFVEWFGYSASVSPYIIKQFEKWAGYKFRPEYIVDKGYHNSCFRNPSKEFKDFMRFQQIEVAKLARELVDIVHSHNKEAMMFLGDHWIGTEPYGEYFKDINLDAVVGSVGNGVTLRTISDIKDVRYREGRFLPYFFPDVFNENGNPIFEAKDNWLKARRAILRSCLDRIGYGGYLKLAYNTPGFIDTIEKIIEEFRIIRALHDVEKPYVAPFKIAILSAFGKIRTWMCNQVHHAIDYREVSPYFGILECLSGMPFEIEFISFDDLLKGIDPNIKVIINAGKEYTSWSGGSYFKDPNILVKLREFVALGGGFIGLGDPSAYEYSGRYYQLADVMGVEKEILYTMSYDKYYDINDNHFILEDINEEIDFGEGAKAVYAINEDIKVLKADKRYVNLACNDYGKGRSVYFSGLVYNALNTKVLLRAIYYAAGMEKELKRFYLSNPKTEIAIFKKQNKAVIINNTHAKQESELYINNKLYEKYYLKENEMLIIDLNEDLWQI